jgi:NhaP-type Na+/H+ or K+/H+ antiporter
LIGPVAQVFDPARDIGPLMGPMISIAVAIILFEGGLTLNFHSLQDSVKGVRRLVFIGAPLGWLTSALAIRYGAGLSWESSAVFGGIMIVTGPTVIAPLLRTARLSRRPAALLQWEAMVNDPIGAVAAVLAFEVVLVLNTATTVGHAVQDLIIGIGFATILGILGGFGLARSFKRAWVPEYMKVPVLFALLLGIFALSDSVLHESGLLAVTIMGIVIANSNLPSYEELRRFKEHATVLLVSGVFILLAASLDFAALGKLNYQAAVFVGAVILLARPFTVLVSLLGSGVPYKEQLLVAFTGPRGVVLVAVAGLFGERLLSLGFEDAALIGPLAFVLVAVTVILHGFTLAPVARFLGLTGADTPGVILIGGSPWTTAFAEALKQADVPILMTDPNFGNLRSARVAGIETFSGDILSEAAEQRLELVSYATLVAATDNDAYNTLVATDLAPEFGRDNVFQVMREKSDNARHQLPRTLGGAKFGPDLTHAGLNNLMREGWTFRITRLTDEFTAEDWRETSSDAHVFARIDPKGVIKLIRKDDDVKGAPDVRIVALRAPVSNDEEPVN